MSESHILFSGAEVRAILAGTMTQTRRLLKGCLLDDVITADHGEKTHLKHIHQWWTNGKRHFACPYGQPGDRLWVRETLRRDFLENVLTGKRDTNAEVIYYAADDEPAVDPHGFNYSWVWQRASLPSIHMPRWASRITLEVIGVRVERLADISQADCVAEGCPGGPDRSPTPRQQYMVLWDTINAKRAPWASNPWVWVVEFKRVPA